MPPTISPIPGEADILSEGQSSTARDDLFPPELVDMFLGYAVDDKDLPTLKAASLVCRSWWALSCPYIFRRVVVISESSLEGLAGFLEPDQGAHRYISTLAIHPRPTEPFGPAHWVDDVPAKLAAMGPRLRVLELVQLNEHDTHLGAGFVRGLAGFAAVDSLTLHECSMTPPLLRALLSAPPALRTVTVRSLITTQVGTGAVLPCLRSPALRSLEVRPTAGYTSSAENILPWIATTATAQSLRALRLTVRISESVGVGQFVLAVGERLEELELELEPFLDLPLETAVMKQNIVIASCTQLRSFAVYDADVLSPAVVGFINELNSQRLETISLKVTSDVTDPALLPDLSSLAASLSERRLSSLKAVCIGYHGPLAIDVAQKKFEVSLAALHARKILAVYAA